MGIEDLLGDYTSTDGLSAAEREDRAKDVAEKSGYAAAALTFLPIPLSDAMVMPIHVGMVAVIARVYGVDISRDSVTKLVLRIGATVGLSFVGQIAARYAASTVVKAILPGVGALVAGAVNASFVFASTIALGAVARLYFMNEGELSDDEIKAIYKETLKRAKERYDPGKAKGAEAMDLAKAAAAEAKQSETDTPDAPAAAGEAPASTAEEPEEDPVARLERLKALLDKGLIEAEEYEAVKQRILDAI